MHTCGALCYPNTMSTYTPSKRALQRGILSRWEAGLQTGLTMYAISLFTSDTGAAAKTVMVDAATCHDALQVALNNHPEEYLYAVCGPHAYGRDGFLCAF